MEGAGGHRFIASGEEGGGVPRGGRRVGGLSPAGSAGRRGSHDAHRRVEPSIHPWIDGRVEATHVLIISTTCAFVVAFWWLLVLAGVCV
jgi:hypothetical protein